MWLRACDARYNPAMEYTLERTLPFDDFVNALTISPGGGYAVAQPVTPARNPWSLQVVSLSDGAVIARVVLGDVSAAMLALAPEGRRVACVPSDGTRAVQVYAPG